MDYKELFKHIYKYKWFIIIIPILTVVVTHYKVKNLPKQYMSEALLSTGFVDQSKQVSGIPDLDFFKTGQQFTNIIEKVKLKKVMDMLAYSLIIHDLENPRYPFENFSKKLDSMSVEERDAALQQFKIRFAKRQPLSLSDDESMKLYEIIASMYYDEENVNKSLVVSHTDGSDFISVTFTSGNPKFSAFVVNSLSQNFIDINNRDIDENQGNSIGLLDSLLKKKEAAMNNKEDSLRDFKNKSGVLNLEKQSETAYSDLAAARVLKDVAERKILGDQQAINNIEGKLQGKDPFVNNNNLGADNKEIIILKNQITVAQNKQIDDNFKSPADQRKIDSLNALLSVRINRNSDNNIIDPVNARAGLISQRGALQTELDQAKGSLPSLDKQIAQLSGAYNKMVPFDANIQNYQRDADQAVKEYNDALNRYNLTKTQQSIGTRANMAQYGVEEAPQPSKSKIYVIISGLASFTLCFAMVIALFFLDTSIKTAKQLANATGLPVIGNLNNIKIADEPIKHIWHDTSNMSYVAFKNLLRSIRLEITSQMLADNSKILGITSLNPGEGRSFIASCLAYAFAMTGKQVLLIGAETQAIENSNTRPELRDKFENFLEKKEIHVEHLITTLNKNDSNTSLLELENSGSVKAGFEILKNEFDIIIIDVNSLRDINLAKEWLLFTEKNLAVFKAGTDLSERDMDLLVHLRNQPGFMGWVLNKVKLSKSII